MIIGRDYGKEGHLHSIVSLVTISTELPTRLNLKRGTFSLRDRHLRVRLSIASNARRPTSPLTLRISSNQELVDAVTASFI